MSASISVTWPVPSGVYVPVAWLNVICAMSVHAGFVGFRAFCSCSPKFFLARHTSEKWLAFPQ